MTTRVGLGNLPRATRVNVINYWAQRKSSYRWSGSLPSIQPTCRLDAVDIWANHDIKTISERLL